MLDIGGWELLVVAVVALIVVGPKDLPTLVRNVGRWVSKARGMAREFQAGMEAAAKETEVDEFRQIGALKSDFERQARDISRGAQDLLSEAEAEPPRRESNREPNREPRGGERIEPGFDSDRRPSRYADRDRPGLPREERYDRAADHDDDDALDRFQSGMRRRD